MCEWKLYIEKCKECEELITIKQWVSTSGIKAQHKCITQRNSSHKIIQMILKRSINEVLIRFWIQLHIAISFGKLEMTMALSEQAKLTLEFWIPPPSPSPSPSLTREKEVNVYINEVNAYVKEHEVLLCGIFLEIFFFLYLDFYLNKICI